MTMTMNGELEEMKEFKNLGLTFSSGGEMEAEVSRTLDEGQ